MKRIFLFLVVLFWIIAFAIGSILFYLRKVNTITKKAVIAGYAEGDIMRYELLLYEDSTYYLSTINLIGYNGLNKWMMSDDTIELKYKNSIAAKIYANKLTEYQNVNFECISIMELKRFEPPKIVKFPTPR